MDRRGLLPKLIPNKRTGAFLNNNDNLFTNVSAYETIPFCLSVRPSILPPLSFLVKNMSCTYVRYVRLKLRSFVGKSFDFIHFVYWQE